MTDPKPNQDSGEAGLVSISDVTEAQTLAPVSMARCNS
jgi:hypothetical protein